MNDVPIHLSIDSTQEQKRQDFILLLNSVIEKIETL